MQQYFIDDTVIVGDNVKIEPFAVIKGKTVLGDGCVVGSFSYLENAVIGANTVVKSSRICDSIVGSDCSVGPNAHLRDNARVGDFCRVGNFVEIKKRRCYHTLTDAGPAPIRAAQMTKFEEGAKNMKKMKRTLAQQHTRLTPPAPR